MALDFNTTTNIISAGDGAGIELDPGATEIVTINNGVLLPDGTKSEPSVRFSDDNNTGIYSPTNEQVGITGNGELVLVTEGVASAVNYVHVTNSATGNDLIIAAAGTDTNVDIDIQPKGTGKVLIGGTEVAKVGDAPTSHTHVMADITDSTWISDYTVTEGDVTAHQGALSITESQISDLGSYITGVAWGDVTGTLSNQTDLQSALDGKAASSHTHVMADITDSTWISDYTVTEGDVTAHQAALSITESQISDLGSYAAASHVHEGTTIDATGVTDGYVLTADGAGNAAWEAASGGGASQLSDLSDVNTSTPTNRNVLVADGVDWESRALTEADISDLGSYLTSVQAGDIDSQSATDGYVLTADGAGNAAWEEVSGGGGGGEDYFAENYNGTLPVATGSDSLAIGEDSEATGGSSIGIGKYAKASNTQSISIGIYAQTSGSNSINISNNGNSCSGTNSVIIGGMNSSCGATGCVGIGRNMTVQSNYSIVVGADALIGSSATGGIAVGRASGLGSTGDYSVVNGYYAFSNAYESVVIGRSASSNDFANTCIILQARKTQAGGPVTIRSGFEGQLYIGGSDAQYVIPSYASGSEPTGVTGGLIYDSTNNKLKFYNGSSWETVTSS